MLCPHPVDFIHFIPNPETPKEASSRMTATMQKSSKALQPPYDIAISLRDYRHMLSLCPQLPSLAQKARCSRRILHSNSTRGDLRGPKTIAISRLRRRKSVLRGILLVSPIASILMRSTLVCVYIDAWAAWETRKSCTQKQESRTLASPQGRGCYKFWASERSLSHAPT